MTNDDNMSETIVSEIRKNSKKVAVDVIIIDQADQIVAALHLQKQQRVIIVTGLHERE